jgi:hypothetical protein
MDSEGPMVHLAKGVAHLAALGRVVQLSLQRTSLLLTALWAVFCQGILIRANVYANFVCYKRVKIPQKIKRIVQTDVFWR